MPLLQWNEVDFIACLEVEPTIDEHQVCYTFLACREGVDLRLAVWQYESVVQISIALASLAQPLIDLVVFVRESAVWRQDGGSEWLELRDCVLAGSRFSYIEMGDVFDQRRHPPSLHV